jgi:hypothetical protein
MLESWVPCGPSGKFGEVILFQHIGAVEEPRAYWHVACHLQLAEGSFPGGTYDRDAINPLGEPKE